MSGKQKRYKLFKVRGAKETTKYGVAALNLKELCVKGCAFLKVPVSGSSVCLHVDGSPVDTKRFEHLPEHAELVLLAKGEHWGGVTSNISLLLRPEHRHADQLIQTVKRLFQGEESPKTQKILRDLLQNLQDSSELEDREADKDWFQGIESRFKTKSAYMRYNCENRVRGYMKEVDTFIARIQSQQVRSEYKKVAECLVERLKADRYNGSYFDRREAEPKRLCTEEGWFSCQGAFDVDRCSTLHSINPYGNRESRILFSTWNLDHVIEKKRTIIPTIAKALMNHNSSDINWEYFYQLLFTRENLKLVNIVCHKKSAHGLECDRGQMYKRKKPKSLT